MSCNTCRGFNIKITKKQLMLAESSFLNIIKEDIDSSGNLTNISSCLKDMVNVLLNSDSTQQAEEGIRKASIKYFDSHKQDITIDINAGISPNLMKKLASFEESLKSKGIDLEVTNYQQTYPIAKDFYKKLDKIEKKEIKDKIKRNLIPNLKKAGEDFSQIAIMYGMVLPSYAKILAKMTIAGSLLKNEKEAPSPSIELPSAPNPSSLEEENKSLKEIKILIKKINNNKNILDEKLQFKSAEEIFAALMDKFKIKNIPIRDLIKHIDDSYDQIKASKSAKAFLRAIINNLEVKIATRKVDLSVAKKALTDILEEIKIKKTERLTRINDQISSLERRLRKAETPLGDSLEETRLRNQIKDLEELKTRKSTMADDLEVQKLDNEIEKLETKLQNEGGIIKSRQEAIQKDIDDLNKKKSEVDKDYKALPKEEIKVVPKKDGKKIIKNALAVVTSFSIARTAGEIVCTKFGISGLGLAYYIRAVAGGSTALLLLFQVLSVPFAFFTRFTLLNAIKNPKIGPIYGLMSAIMTGSIIGCYRGIQNSMANNGSKLDAVVGASEFTNSATQKMGLVLNMSQEEINKKYLLINKKDLSDFDIALNALNPIYDDAAYGDMAQIITKNFPSIWKIALTGFEIGSGTMEALTSFDDTIEENKLKVKKFTEYLKKKLEAKVPDKFVDLYELYTRILVNSGISEPSVIQKIISCSTKDVLTTAINPKNSEALMAILDVLKLSKEAGVERTLQNVELQRQQDKQKLLDEIEKKIQQFNSAIALLSKDAEGKIKYFGLDDNIQNLKDSVTRYYGSLRDKSEEQKVKSIAELQKRWNEINKLVKENEDIRDKHAKALKETVDEGTARFHENNKVFYDNKAKFYRQMLQGHRDFNSFLQDIKDSYNQQDLTGKFNKPEEKKCDQIKAEYEVAYKMFRGYFIKDYKQGEYIVKLNKDLNLKNPELYKVISYVPQNKTITIVEEESNKQETYKGKDFDSFLKITSYYGKGYGYEN